MDFLSGKYLANACNYPSKASRRDPFLPETTSRIQKVCFRVKISLWPTLLIALNYLPVAAFGRTDTADAPLGFQFVQIVTDAVFRDVA